jgi:hypothetical protein
MSTFNELLLDRECEEYMPLSCLWLTKSRLILRLFGAGMWSSFFFYYFGCGGVLGSHG